MKTTSRVAAARTLLCSLTLVTFATSVAAQVSPYVLMKLPQVPGALDTVAYNLNETGQVVGAARFSTAPFTRACLWDVGTGVTLLPQPAGYSDYAAVDVNNAGVVLGDGAGENFGWRYEAGSYVSLGALGGLPASFAHQLNESGDAALTSDDFTQLVPPRGTLAERGQPLVETVPDGYASALNERRQVVGHTSALSAYRYTPGSGALDLGPLGTRLQTTAADVNAFGDVVGRAAFAGGSGSVPFLFTDAGGMEEIESFGDDAAAVALNDRGEVVGEYTPSNDPQPWLWSRTRGLEYLEGLIDSTGIQVGLVSVTAINEAGVILARGIDLTSRDEIPVLLQPLDARGWSAPRNGAGHNAANLRALTAPVIAGSFDLDVDAGVVPGATTSAVVAYGSALPGVLLPFGELLVDVSGSFVAADVQAVAGGQAQHDFPVPNEFTLAGTPATFQGVLLGSGPQLTSALDALIGF